MRKIISFFFICQFISCASGPVETPEGATADKLIQLGQEASDKNKYDQALQYYQAVIDRFPTQIDSVCSAEYEIAFIHYKQKKYSLVRQELNALLARYDEPDAELLPGEYKTLATIVLDKISPDKG
ncbi:MAG: hypothetical protein LBL45_10020 [Treponema sp.]|jgi:outer membrane protein assembly factor BamD (BamD/ComL family)|nr:hypothetical protein [Treponema sp.]